MLSKCLNKFSNSILLCYYSLFLFKQMIAQFEFSYHYAICSRIWRNISWSKIMQYSDVYISYKIGLSFNHSHASFILSIWLEATPSLLLNYVFLKLFLHCYFNRLRYFESIRFTTSFGKIIFNWNRVSWESNKYTITSDSVRKLRPSYGVWSGSRLSFKVLSGIVFWASSWVFLMFRSIEISYQNSTKIQSVIL